MNKDYIEKLKNIENSINNEIIEKNINNHNNIIDYEHIYIEILKEFNEIEKELFKNEYLI